MPCHLPIRLFLKYKILAGAHLAIASLLIAMVMTVSFSACAEESIEYVAEHLLETPMDTRALAFPTTPANIRSSESRVQLGYSSFDAGRLNNTVPMLGAQFFTPLNDTWGLIAGAFYDRYQFSGSKGKAIGGVLTVHAPEVPKKFDVDITNVSGSGRYTGASMALTFSPEGPTDSPEGLWRWEVGVAYEDMNINKFAVDFNTTSLVENFSGRFDYASHYRIHTLFFGVEMTPQQLGASFTYSPHVIVVRNSPRVGFQGRFSGPGFDYSGNTDTNHEGKHIPDNYMGVGVNFEHRPSGLRMDLGATLYTYAVEPAGHKGISKPIFLTLSCPFL